MEQAESGAFAESLKAVYALYRVEFTDAVAMIWWQALKGFELAAVREAFGRHAMNPDVGQYLPKPADVVRELGGTSSDAALIAWHKAVNAMRDHGTYESVTFDDPIIHRVLLDLGGWVWFGTQTEKEMPFIEKRFRDAYRVWRSRGFLAAPVSHLAGIIETQNSAKGFKFAPPVLIGNHTKALEVKPSPAANATLPQRDLCTKTA